MSTNDETVLALLSEQARQTRSLLKRDIQALVFKVSPTNLKREALDAARDMALGAKASVVRWGLQTKDFAQTHSVATSLAIGVGCLLYAATSPRRRPLLLACAAACGAAAVLSARRAKRQQLPPPTSDEGKLLLPLGARVTDVS